MALTVVESKPRGFSGLPTPSSLRPYKAGGGDSFGSLRPRNGRVFGTLTASQPLTVILDATAPVTFSYLFFTVDNNANALIDHIKVTVNGEVIHDVIDALGAGKGVVIMLCGDAFYGSESTNVTATDRSGGAVFNGAQMVADTLKIEIATGAGGIVNLRGDLEMIQ